MHDRYCKTDASELDFTNFIDGQPDSPTETSDCVKAVKNNGIGWDDAECEASHLLSVCKKPATIVP